MMKLLPSLLVSANRNACQLLWVVLGCQRGLISLEMQAQDTQDGHLGDFQRIGAYFLCLHSGLPWLDFVLGKRISLSFVLFTSSSYSVILT
jgi:hypothetical protein